jgi:steroid delta-isomerase-like uncharacterized protein
MADNAAIVREFVEKVLNKGEIDATGRYFWEDVVEHIPFPGQGTGLKGLQDVLRGMKAAFPDMHWKIEEQITEGDRVMSRFVWTGTHRGPFLGIPATGKPVTVWGIVIDRLVDKRIKETRIIMDTLGMMGQMGAIPGPGN